MHDFAQNVCPSVKRPYEYSLYFDTLTKDLFYNCTILHGIFVRVIRQTKNTKKIKAHMNHRNIYH